MESRIVALGASADEQRIVEMLDAGVAGYLLESEPLPVILQALYTAAGGRPWHTTERWYEKGRGSQNVLTFSP